MLASFGQKEKWRKIMDSNFGLILGDASCENFPVDGRKLYETLEVGSNYTTWFNRMCEFGFEANKDFETLSFFGKRADGTQMPTATIDHHLTISMAKEICMLQRTEQGREIRRYLISIENKWNDPDAIVYRAMGILQGKVANLQAQNAALAQQAAIDAPKVEYFDKIGDANGTILVRDMAKLLVQSGVRDMGGNRFHARLRMDGYLGKDGMDYNMPTQRSMELGIFMVHETNRIYNGGIATDRTVRVTAKGKQYLYQKYTGNKPTEMQ
jgi:anti-repressor protein